MKNALGMIETMSIPLGIFAADAMLKAAGVDLVTSQAVCAGKYIVVVEGEVSSVRSSVEAGKEAAGSTLVDSLVIAGIHEQVAPAINAAGEIEKVEALGVMESYSLCAAVTASDAAVKAAPVQLVEVRLGRGLGGKAFVLFTGEVAAVESAVRAAEAVEEIQGMLGASVIIPSPHKKIAEAIL
ncbi:MAG: BMC domain-containing protein [Treponema sp.]|jgi:microcompartment protein CcmL/EutN|nr:BMC domain-containing protein [Treponema sp.]